VRRAVGRCPVRPGLSRAMIFPGVWARRPGQATVVLTKRLVPARAGGAGTWRGHRLRRGARRRRPRSPMSRTGPPPA